MNKLYTDIRKHSASLAQSTTNSFPVTFLVVHACKKNSVLSLNLHYIKDCGCVCTIPICKEIE